jgi:predicted RNA-binding Zn-ribbon protein involved in translation (DUF1610 family)
MTNQQDYWMSEEDVDHGWQPSSSDCPICGNQLSEMYCVNKSCTICLGLTDGYRCDNCQWSGDTYDLVSLRGKGQDDD